MPAQSSPPIAYRLARIALAARYGCRKMGATPSPPHGLNKFLEVKRENT